MKNTFSKSLPVPESAKCAAVAVAATALSAAALMCAGCTLFDFSVPRSVQQRMEKEWVLVFTDETDKVRAVSRGPAADINQPLQCVDDNSIWRPDFQKTLDLARGYASTRPVKAITTLP
jgi:hypothetical protein